MIERTNVCTVALCHFPGLEQLMKVTIKDVARLAQVSPSTVSRALQGSTRISAEMRENIQQIADELGFRPNQMARSLVKRHSHIVGVMFPGSAANSMGHPFYPAVLRGVGQIAGERGYHMLLSTGNENMSDADAVRDLADTGYVSGLLLLAAQDSPLEELLPTQPMPVVEIGHPPDAANRYYVDTDNIRAGETVTRYLLDRGHRRILFLGYSARFFVTVDRRTGYENALRASGIQPKEAWIVPSRFIENNTDNAILHAIFTGDDRPTAVVSMDDPLSIGLISFLQTLGLSVPKDVSIISFNNTQAGEYAMPALTSVDIKPQLLGARAMKLLLNVIEGRTSSPTHIEVPFTLIERGSVAPYSQLP